MSLISKVYGVDGAHDSPYRLKIQLPFGWRLHKFYRPDLDRAWHDHPNHFWTLPFASYWGEVLDRETGERRLNLVEAWRWHYRPATYTHRLAGRARLAAWRDTTPDPRPHWTLVREILPEFKEWGFFVELPDGVGYRYIPWRDYIFEGVR